MSTENFILDEAGEKIPEETLGGFILEESDATVIYVGKRMIGLIVTQGTT